jgi:hypothetical protein
MDFKESGSEGVDIVADHCEHNRDPLSLCSEW